MYLVNILILYNLLEYLHRASIAKKLDTFGGLGHFVANTVGVSGDVGPIVGFKIYAFSVITKSNRHYAVRGHDSRSPIWCQSKAGTRLSIND